MEWTNVRVLEFTDYAGTYGPGGMLRKMFFRRRSDGGVATIMDDEKGVERQWVIDMMLSEERPEFPPVSVEKFNADFEQSVINLDGREVFPETVGV